jgi:hypothetical protein
VIQDCDFQRNEVYFLPARNKTENIGVFDGRYEHWPRDTQGLHDARGYMNQFQNPKFNANGPNPTFKLLVLAGVTFARVSRSCEGIPSVRASMFESIP